MLPGLGAGGVSFMYSLTVPGRYARAMRESAPPRAPRRKPAGENALARSPAAAARHAERATRRKEPAEIIGAGGLASPTTEAGWR